MPEQCILVPQLEYITVAFHHSPLSPSNMIPIDRLEIE